MKKWERYLLYALAVGSIGESAARRMNDGQFVALNAAITILAVIPYLYFVWRVIASFVNDRDAAAELGRTTK